MRNKLGFALVVLVLVVGIAEVVLRISTRELANATIPDDLVRLHVKDGAMNYHPQLGWVRADLPNRRLGLNSAGFRYDEVSIEKPEGTWRAFTLGDSQTYGAGSYFSETYTAIAERTLRERTGRGQDLEMINAGISGYGSLQVLRLIETKLLQWDPDLLVVDCRTYDQPKDGVLPSIRGPRARMEGLLWHSRIYYVLRFWLERLRPTTGRDMQAPAQRADDDLRKARFGNHQAIWDLADREGIGLVFADYPVWDKSRNRIICQSPPEELPEGAVVARACLAMQESARPATEFFLDPNHLRPEGNRLFGEVLVEAVMAGEFRP